MKNGIFNLRKRGRFIFLNNKYGQIIAEKIAKKGERFKICFENGKSMEWDLCMFGPILSSTPFEIKKNFEINKLIEIRNEISHKNVMCISKQYYDDIFLRWEKSIKKLGYTQHDLNNFQKNLELNQKPIQKENNFFVELHKIAEKEVSNDNFSKVIELYNEINLNDLSNEETCQLYYTRSHAYLKLHQLSNKRDEKNAYKALNDAENICIRKPSWSKGYQRAAEIYLQLNDLENAKKFYDKALCLDLGNDYLKNSLAYLKNSLEKQSRNDHLNEKAMPYTSEEGFENFRQNYEQNNGSNL